MYGFNDKFGARAGYRQVVLYAYCKIASLIILIFDTESKGERIEPDRSDARVGLYIGCPSDVKDLY